MTILREVTLTDVSVETFWQLQRHQEDMLREFALIAFSHERGDGQAVPARLLELVTDLRARFSASRGALIDEMEKASREGADTITVTISLPVAAAASVQATCAVFEEADAYCRSGDLLTLAASPEVAELRRRLCAEIVAQLTT